MARLIPSPSSDTPILVRQALQRLGKQLGSTSTVEFGDIVLNNLSASLLLQTDASKKTASVADLTDWIAGTANRVTVADDGDGTVTLSGPQDLHTGAKPQFEGLGIGEAGVLGEVQITSEVNGIKRVDIENTSDGNNARAGFIARTDAAQYVMDAFGSGHGTNANDVWLEGISSTTFLIWARQIGDAGAIPELDMRSGGSHIVLSGTNSLVTLTSADLRLSDNHEIRFYDDGENYVGFEAPALDADQIWVLPDADGNAGEVLSTDAGGNLSWTDVVPGAPAAHTHDGDTLQLDGVNSDGGAFSFTTSGAVTFSQNLIIPSDGFIGSVDDVDAIQIEADGDVVMSQDLAITGTLGVTGIATLADGSALATDAAPVADAQIANKKYVDDSIGVPGAHTHDGDTLQIDGINSDGGAFAFSTTGAVTFNQSIILSAGCDMTVAGHVIFNTNNSYIGFDDPRLTFDDNNNQINVTGKLVLPDSGYLGSVSDPTALQILAAGDVVLTDSLYTNKGLYLLERADDVGDVATWGHIWVKDDVPNTLWFTDDAGTNFQLGTPGGAHTHDGDTLQLDGVNSDGGAFAFATTGAITFSQDLILPDGGALKVADGNPQIVLDNTNGYVEITGKVGIGTTTPYEALEVATAGGAGAGERVIFSDGQGADRRVILLQIPCAATDYGRIVSYKYGTGSGYKPLRIEASQVNFHTLDASQALVGIADSAITPDSKLEIQTETDEGCQVLTLDQNDEDKGFIDYQGTSAADAAHSVSSYTTGNSIEGFIRNEVNGSEVWMPYFGAPDNTGFVTSNYIPRGIVGAYDFTLGNFTRNGAWNDLDISGIIPAGVRLVHLKFNLKATAVGMAFYVSHIDGLWNAAQLATQVANVTAYVDVIVPCTSDRKFRYLATNSAAWSGINFAIRGWWK